VTPMTPVTSAPLEGASNIGSVERAEREEAKIPVVEERLAVGKRLVETGVVRIHASVHEREEVVDEPLTRRKVSVETVAINQMVDGPRPTVRQEGDLLIVPICEEVVVVEKRWMLKEELRIRQLEETFHEPLSVTVRRDEVSVERIPTEPADSAGAVDA